MSNSFKRKFYVLKWSVKCLGLSKTLNLEFSQTPLVRKKEEKNLPWWYYSLSFTCSYQFQWPWQYFKVKRVSNSSYWNFMLLSNYLKLDGIVKYVKQIMNVSPIWWLQTSKGGNWHFLIWKIFNIGFLGGHHWSKIFQTWHDHKLPSGLHFQSFILFQDHRFVRIVNCKLIFRYLSIVV